MIKKLILLSVVSAPLFLSTGCLTVATPAMGTLITDVKWDGEAHGPIGTKEGRACAQSVLGLVSSGDASIKAAAANGGITDVQSVDHHTKWTLLFGEYCTIARGK